MVFYFEMEYYHPLGWRVNIHKSMDIYFSTMRFYSMTKTIKKYCTDSNWVDLPLAYLNVSDLLSFVG